MYGPQDPEEVLLDTLALWALLAGDAPWVAHLPVTLFQGRASVRTELMKRGTMNHAPMTHNVGPAVGG